MEREGNISILVGTSRSFESDEDRSRSCVEGPRECDSLSHPVRSTREKASGDDLD